MDSVLIVAHGRGDGDAFVHGHAEALQEIVGVPVRCAFRRHSEERVRPAMESIADSGARDLAVIPFFMTDNVYVRSIPKAMGLREGGMEGVYERGGNRVSYRTMAPFGESPAFLEMMCQIAEGHPGAGIVIVAAAHGSSPPPRAAGAALEALRSRGFEAAVCGSADAESVRRAGEGMSQIVAVPFTIGAAVDPIEGVTVTGPVGMDPRVPSAMARMLEGLRRPRGHSGTGLGGERRPQPGRPVSRFWASPKDCPNPPEFRLEGSPGAVARLPNWAVADAPSRTFGYVRVPICSPKNLCANIECWTHIPQISYTVATLTNVDGYSINVIAWKKHL